MLELSVKVLPLLMAVEWREKVATTLSANALHQSPEETNGEGVRVKAAHPVANPPL